MGLNWVVSEEDEEDLIVAVVLRVDVDLVKASKVALIVLEDCCSAPVVKVVNGTILLYTELIGERVVVDTTFPTCVVVLDRTVVILRSVEMAEKSVAIDSTPL